MPKARAPSAQARRSASSVPSRMRASANVFSKRERRWFGVERSIMRTYGTEPRARIHSTVAAGNARLRYQLFEK